MWCERSKYKEDSSPSKTAETGFIGRILGQPSASEIEDEIDGGGSVRRYVPEIKPEGAVLHAESRH
jgi:hypothetical protein